MQLNGSFDVKLGKSFLDKDSTSYMTMRCDFMPASVDRSQPGSIKVNEGKEVVVSLPNIANVGSENTVFRGSARPVQKECILIYNRKTKELTLERIAHTVQLKKTREERKPDSINLNPNLSSDNNNNQTQNSQNTQSDNHANAKTLCHSPTKWKSTESEQSSNQISNQSIQPAQKKVKHSRTRISSSSSSSSSDSDADDSSSSSSSSSSDSNSTSNNTASSSSSSDTSVDMDVVSSDSNNHSGSDSDSNSSSLSSLSSGKKLSKKPSSNTKPTNKKTSDMTTIGNSSNTNTANTNINTTTNNNNSHNHANSNSSMHGNNNNNQNNLAAHRKLIEHDLKLSDSDSDGSI